MAQGVLYTSSRRVIKKQTQTNWEPMSSTPSKRVTSKVGTRNNLSACGQTTVEKITKRVTDRASQASLPIQRVPKALRDRKKSAYTPDLVSVGPLHSTDKHLRKQGMQHIKEWFASLLFRRVAKDDDQKIAQVVIDCTSAMEGCKEKAREFYSERADDMTEEMLVIDGCFVLEVLYRSHPEFSEEEKKHPVLDSAFMRHALQHDLLLLENQLPLFFLEKLFHHTLYQLKSTLSLGDYVVSYWRDMIELEPDEQTKCCGLKNCNISIFDNSENSGNESSGEKGYNLDAKHILHLLHNHYCQRINWEEKSNASNIDKTGSKLSAEKRLTPSASTLHCSGIKFVSGAGKHLFDIGYDRGSFGWCRRPRFKIPIRCTDRTESFLRNLIAFEQFFPGSDVLPHFTSYAFLMNSLIDTAADVEVLVDAGVMQNSFETSEEAANLYNNLTKEVTLDMNRFCFAEICRNADEYSKLFWPKFRAWPASLVLHLSRTYLATPWTFIGFFLAFVTVSITVANFILRFYYKPPKA